MKEIFSTKIFKNGLINEVHASTLLKLEDGRMLCAFFGGTKEGKDDVKIWLSIFENGEWSLPVIVADPDGVPAWNPVLFDNGNEIILFYKEGKPIPEWRTMYKTSRDGGLTWSEEAELVKGDIGGRGPVKNKAIKLKNGAVLAPASIETKTQWDAFTDISFDGCKTWEKSGFVPFDHEESIGKGIIQPTLWEDGDKIYMLIRSTESSVMRSVSSDGAKTWSEAEKTPLIHNNSGIDCVRLPDGRIFLVHNPLPGRRGDRNVIAYSISEDNGETFLPCVEIEHDEDSDAEFSYPAAITDGKYIYVSYTHYRKNIMYRIFEI